MKNISIALFLGVRLTLTRMEETPLHTSKQIRLLNSVLTAMLHLSNFKIIYIFISWYIFVMNLGPK